MAECIVCGEKIEDGKQYCNVCAPENHEKVESSLNNEALTSNDEQNEAQENRIEIKKDSIVLEDTDSDDKQANSDSEDNG